jgi:hypothetical protein
MRKYGYAWITIAFSLVSIIGYRVFGWYAFVDGAADYGKVPEINTTLVEMGRDTFENWQSEFLHLLWQVVELAYFLYAGSPASKENDDRAEAKLDALIRLHAGEKAKGFIEDIDRRFLRTGGHAQPHAHSDQQEEARHLALGHA